MLPTVLWLALFLFAIGFFLYIIRGINKNIFLLKNALIWLLISIVLIIFAIFPHVAEWLAMAFGFETTSNFLLSAAVIVLLIMEIKNSVLISKHENRIKTLLQELSIMKYEEKWENREGKND
ncbi:TPA: DUF2304 domain-containing protein [Enterococcus faecalis]|uniref:DUF2304 domain-containing protein n=1 Tax=Enterococcus faecalis TaxID=1351 RepID=UPI000DFBCEB2|nr:DUF2304 domain-containing protein [Enterococcus faecalis]STP98294.1 Uncharacterized conserved protein (DUF2304) [Enterococcus faecalis]HAP5241705.1 DUF2304 domain-containing protein [Enterococcus faecalis]